MDKTYTFKEASQLIKTYSRILNQLISSKDNTEKYKKRIFNDATFFLKKFYFQNNIVYFDYSGCSLFRCVFGISFEKKYLIFSY